MLFKVIEIIDPNTITVSPNWMHEGKIGNIVKIKGQYHLQNGEYGYEFKKKKLNTLLKDKEVQLYSPNFVNSNFKELYCYVYIDGIDCLNYFPEFGKIKLI